jgi:hypothetical protein
MAPLAARLAVIRLAAIGVEDPRAIDTLVLTETVGESTLGEAVDTLALSDLAHWTSDAADTLALTDEVITDLERVFDTLTLSDSATTNQDANLAVVETISLTELAEGGFEYVASAADTLVLADTAAPTEEAVDTLVLTETVEFPETAADALNLTEVVGLNGDFHAAVTDSLSLTEALAESDRSIRRRCRVIARSMRAA